MLPGGVKSESDFHLSWDPLLTKYNQHSERYHKLRRTNNASNNNAQLDHFIPTEIGYRLCALRETFEESGILIANDESGNEVVLSNPDEHIGGKYATLHEWRNNVYKDPQNFQKMFQ